LRRWLWLVALTACATAPAVRPGTPSRPLAPSAPSRDVAQLVGWSADHPVTLASARWSPVVGATGLEAVVLERRVGDQKEVVLALVRAGELVGSVPLARVTSGPPHPRSVGATLAELPLGAGDRALRVDVRTFDGGEAQLFAVKTTLVALAGDRPVRLLDRLVESGDRVRDRRADLTVRDLDGDGTPELIVEERESGASPPRTVVYRRGRDGRYVTKDPSIFGD